MESHRGLIETSKVMSKSLQMILLEFTMTYLLEQPDDILEFGVHFFTTLKNNRMPSLLRENTVNFETSLTQEENDTQLNKEKTRRKSFSAETYDPEEDFQPFPTVIFPKTPEQRLYLMEIIKKHLLFRPLTDEQLEHLVNVMFSRTVAPEEIVVHQGDEGDYFYIVESGVYIVSVDDVDKTTLNNQGYFGELSLLYNGRRSATVIAKTPGKLWVLDRKMFRRVVIKSTFQKYREYETLLDSIPMLRSLDKSEKIKLSDILLSKNYDDGELIFRQDEKANGMYFIEKGQVSLKYNTMCENYEIKILGKHDFFGELEMITGKPRQLTAQALGYVKVAFLNYDGFELLLGPCSDIMKRNINSYECHLNKIDDTEGRGSVF